MRKIIHCDCDCFFVSVEVREKSYLRGLPVAVGGSPERRGVIVACSYEARRYGVHSGLATARAMRLCPELVLLEPNFSLYREAAQQVRRIFHSYTDQVAPLSLDEAFMDVSDSDYCRGSATLIAEEIRARIHHEVGITASAGVASNKFLAKVGSDWNKPNGLFVLPPEKVAAFVRYLPVQHIYGAGRVTVEKMHRLGVYHCGDLQRLSLHDLTQHFGSFGHRLHDLCRGNDSRQVKVDKQRKSVSVEHTFSKDLPGLESCVQQLPELQLKLASRLRRLDEHYLPTRMFLKMRFNNFSTTTVERVFEKNIIERVTASY